MSDENFDPLAQFHGISSTAHNQNQKEDKLMGGFNVSA